MALLIGVTLAPASAAVLYAVAHAGRMERLAPALLLGMAAVIAGSMLVVWAGQA